MPRSGSPEASLVLTPGCNLACPVCDCRAEPIPSADVERQLGRGGGVIELRGEAACTPSLAEAVRRARDGGWRTIRARTNGVAFAAAPARARELVDAGLDGAVFFLASDRPAVHDAITRVRGSHTAGLAGLAALAAAGLEISLEVPVLDPSLQDLRATVACALDRAPAARLRLYSPAALRPASGRAPRELLPPRWDRVRSPLREAIAFARDKGLDVTLTERDGIPLCAVAAEDNAGHPVVPEGLIADRGGRPMPRRDTATLGPGCAACPAARACPGTTSLYLKHHGGAGLEKLSRLPALRREARWDETRKKAARAAFFTVLRPTVHCNQDCWFCSANETSHNVEEDPGRMMRRIARLARTGVQQISFSGGEPTLSRHLVDYVEVARRSGVGRVELVTNAVLLDRPEKVDALVRAGVTHVFVSLHAHDEALARLETRKVGDHARTVRALHLLARHEGLRLDVNHVVSVHNYRSLLRFVEWMHAEFGDRIGVSFAFVTPQYKALERLAERLPRYADVMPYLRRALARAHELGLEVVVGSRQGVPPCLLRELLPFSDVLSAISGALTEDAPQKTKGPACAQCRLENVCTGVWKPYAALYGTGELEPLPGEKVSPEIAIAQVERTRFEPTLDAPDALRYGDGRIPSSAELPLPEEPRARVHLPVVTPAEGPPLRTAIFGTGRRGLAFAAAVARTPGFSLVAVASPHAPDKELPEIPRDVPRARLLEEILDRVPLDAVIVASDTRSHAEAARLALGRGLPCLVEKPLAGSIADAEALAAEGGARITVAQQLHAAGGFTELLELLGDRKGPERPVAIEVLHRAMASSPGSLHVWSRVAFHEIFIHLGDLAAALAGEPLVVRRASFSGGGRPEHLSLRMRGAGSSALAASIDLALAAPSDGLTVRVRLEGGRRLTWTREPGRDEVEIADEGGSRTRTPARGGDLERLVASWQRSLREGHAPPVTAEDGVRAMKLAAEMVRALEAAGAPFDRAGEPKRVASVPMRERIG